MNLRKLMSFTASGVGGLLGLLSALIGIAIWLFVTGGTIFLSMYIFKVVTSHFHHTNTTTSIPYVATQDNFQINFPGTPTIQNAPIGSGSGIVSAKIYDYQRNKNSPEYDVMVFTLSGGVSGISNQELRNSLQTDVNDFASAGKTSISNSKFITFKSYTALEVDLNSSQYSQGKLIGFYVNKNEYFIDTFGVSTSSFQSFINSFKVIN